MSISRAKGLMGSPGFFCLLVYYCRYGLFNDALSILDYTASMVGGSAQRTVNWDGRGRPQGLSVYLQYESGYAVLRARFKPDTSLNAGESDRLTCYKAPEQRAVHYVP